VRNTGHAKREHQINDISIRNSNSNKRGRRKSDKSWQRRQEAGGSTAIDGCPEWLGGLWIVWLLWLLVSAFLVFFFLYVCQLNWVALLDDVASLDAVAIAAADDDETGSNCYYQLLEKIEALEVLSGHFKLDLLLS